MRANLDSCQEVHLVGYFFIQPWFFSPQEKIVLRLIAESRFITLFRYAPLKSALLRLASSSCALFRLAPADWLEGFRFFLSLRLNRGLRL